MTALDERTGATRLPVTLPSMPSWSVSSRMTWKLYEVQFRVMSPSLWRSGRRSLAYIGRWQPAQLVIHDEWQVKQVILLSGWAMSLPPSGTSPQVVPSLRIVLASRDRSLYRAWPGVIESMVWGTSHCLPCSTIDRWMIVSPETLNRRWPNGVWSDARLVPPSGAAAADVFRVARASMVPWQSRQSISTALRVSPYSLPLPWLSCEKWQSTQCMPFSRWMSLRWSACLNLSGASGATTL